MELRDFLLACPAAESAHINMQNLLSTPIQGAFSATEYFKERLKILTDHLY